MAGDAECVQKFGRFGGDNKRNSGSEVLVRNTGYKLERSCARAAGFAHCVFENWCMIGLFRNQAEGQDRPIPSPEFTIVLIG
jgi:hypothetical protein